MKKIFVFAGQGSQFYGMGKSQYNSNRVFREIVCDLDRKIVNIYGKSIKSVIFDESKKRSDQFIDFKESSLAILLFEVAAAKMMIKLGVKPDVLIGCSLGEVCAQVVAEVIDINDAINLICEESDIFKEILPKGFMIAVYADYYKVKEMNILDRCELVANNHSKHFVVAGAENVRIGFEEKLRQYNLSYMELPIEYAFHSSQMECAKEKCLDLFNKIKINKSKYPIYSCALSKEIYTIDNNYMWNVLRNSIKWNECIKKIPEDTAMYIDLSADGELASMLRYQLDNYNNVFKISSIFDVSINIDSIINKIKEKGGKKLKAFVFTGQGSQVKGMGKDLFDEFTDLVKKADKILGYSIKDLCLNDSNGLLNRTDYTQPALYMVSTLEYLKRIKYGEEKPDYVAGHSLGEYSALFAAGVVDFETGLKLVKKRGELMAKALGGKMAAVIGLSEDVVRDILKYNNFTTIDVANLNSPTQIVISGLEEDIKKAEIIFSNTDGCIMYKILNVSGAFHSRYMEDARKEFTEYMKNFIFNKPKIPIIANITARPYKEEEILSTLSMQLVSPVRWTDTIRYLMAKGVENFEEIGPGHVLTGLYRKIARESEPLDLSNEENEVKEVKNTDFILGSKEFIKDYNLKYAYTIGSMFRGITGEKMVIEAGKNGILCSFGTGGLSLERIEEAINNIQGVLRKDQPYAFNLMYNINKQQEEENLVELYLKYDVNILEISNYFSITKSIVKYRLKGLKKDLNGNIIEKNHIIVKLSRPEIADGFMRPAPSRIVDALLRNGEITMEEAELANDIPISYDICVEADSGGHTDCRNLFNVLPAICYMRDTIMNEYGYRKKIRIGAAGGIGTPLSVASSFVMGADFITTGSINQCTVEAEISDIAKEMMSTINIQDTGYIEEFNENNYNNKIQVLKKGTLFQVKANKLYSIYKKFESIDEIDDKTKRKIEERYFRKSIKEVWDEIKLHYEDRPEQIMDLEKNPKKKMAIIFNWYYRKSILWAIEGVPEYQIDYQIMCGPSLGAFNQWVKGTELESWENRTIVKIQESLMEETNKYIKKYMENIIK